MSGEFGFDSAVDVFYLALAISRAYSDDSSMLCEVNLDLSLFAAFIPNSLSNSIIVVLSLGFKSFSMNSLLPLWSD